MGEEVRRFAEHGVGNTEEFITLGAAHGCAFSHTHYPTQDIADIHFQWEFVLYPSPHLVGLRVWIDPGSYLALGSNEAAAILHYNAFVYFT